MYLSRREFLQVSLAVSGGLWLSPSALLKAFHAEDLYEFKSLGNVTLLWTGDLHGHLTPNYYREPENNIGVGDMKGQPPHITGEALLQRYGLKPRSVEAYLYTHLDFDRLSKEFGPIGGCAYIAALIRRIRDERPNRVLLMDCGDALQGTAVALWEKGASMVRVMNAMGYDMMTAHWEFTLGKETLQKRIGEMQFEFLVHNCFDAEWEERIFKPYTIREQNGLRIGVIGQGFPYVPIAHPRYLIEGWSFGLRETEVQRLVRTLREDERCDLVVLLSHNGADVDKKMASRVQGIDVILGGHTHDVYIKPLVINNTIVAQAGAHGKFLGRLDLHVQNKKVQDFRYKLYPILANRLQPDPEIEKLITEIRAPYKERLTENVCHVATTLYRRDNFWGTMDQFLMKSIEEAYGADILLSPGFRWGSSVPAGTEMVAEDVYAATAITYPKVYTFYLKGERFKMVLEDIADNLFNPDPYYQQGGDMVRTRGISYHLDLTKPVGERIRELTVRGKPFDPDKYYKIGNWGGQLYRIGKDAYDPDKPIYELAIEFGKSIGTFRLDDEPNLRVTA